MTDEANIILTSLVCLTYKANNYVTPYHFVGKTEEEARAKLDEFLNKKIVKAEEIHTEDSVIVHNLNEESDNAIQAGIGRGFANTGKVWMINHKLQERARVEPNLVEEYIAKGFEKGGPKTRFR